MKRNRYSHSLGTLVTDPKNYEDLAYEETKPYREYMLNESV